MQTVKTNKPLLLTLTLLSASLCFALYAVRDTVFPDRPDGESSTAVGESAGCGNAEVCAMYIDEALPPLEAGMVNVTAGHAAYRVYPTGEMSAKSFSVRIGYDTLKIPHGHQAAEVRTYRYDDSLRHWVKLPLDTVLEGAQQVQSHTSKGGDMINAIVQLPELPESQAFTPTMLQELEAAHPAAGITMMQAPEANSQGTASLSYPISVPAGRNGIQPNLNISYSSGGGNGLLGMGWDMQLPAITVDSKWGVPRYDNTYETECYSYNGQELLPSPHYLSTWEQRNTTGNKRFRPRTEGSFDSIVRCGNGPAEYFWVVTDKGGTKYYYGSYDGMSHEPSVLLKDEGENIGYWPLCRVEDLDGNYMEYHYTVREQEDADGHYLGQQLWPDSIVYTGFGSEKGKYRIAFISGPAPVPEQPSVLFMPNPNPNPEPVPECDCGGYPFDYRSDARSGFLRSGRDKLLRVEIYCGTSSVRRYSFCYGSDIFGRPQLRRIRQWGADIQDGYYEHTLEYYRETTANTLLGSGETSISNIDSLYDGKAVRFLNKLATPFSAVAAQLWGSRTLLAGSRNLGYGASGGADIGIGVNGSSKDNAVSYGISGTYNSGRGLNTLTDVTGDGLPDRIYRKGSDLYFQPQVNGTFGSSKPLRNNADFLCSESKTISHGPAVTIGLSSAAAEHGGFRTNTTYSYTGTYLSDLNGDGLLDLVSNGQAVTLMPASGSPTVTLPESCSVPSVTPDTVKRYPSVSLGHLPEPAVPDADVNVPYYDIVRVWKNGGVQDLGVDIHAKAWLSDSVAGYGNTLQDSVVVSVEFYGHFANDLTHSLHHLLVACDTLGVGDTVWKGNLLSKQPDGKYLLHPEAMASPFVYAATTNSVSMIIDSCSYFFFRARSLHGRAVSHLLEWNPSVVPSGTPYANTCTATHYRDAGVCSFPRSDGMFYSPYTGNASLIIPANRGSSPSMLKVYKNGRLDDSLQSGIQDMANNMTLNQGDSLRFEVCGDTCAAWPENQWHPKLTFSGIGLADEFRPVPHYSCWYPAWNRSLKERRYVPFGEFYGGWSQFQYLWDGAEKMSVNKIFRLRDSSGFFSLNAFCRLTDTAFLKSLADSPSPNLTDTLMYWLGCLPMQPDGERSRYNGCFPNAYIDSGRISLGCVPGLPELEVSGSPVGNGCGAQQGTYTSSTSSRMGNVEDISFSASDKVSFTKSLSLTFSGSFAGSQQTNSSIGGTRSVGNTRMEQDLLDLNGDGVLDVVQGNNVFYSRPLLTTMDVTPQQPMTAFCTHCSGNITDNADAMARTKELVRIPSRSGKGQSSIGASGNTASGKSTDRTEYTLADINGDGLPDMVCRNGHVRLNTGYGFEQGRIWEHLDEIGTALSTSTGIGGGVSVWSDAVSGGLGTTHAYNSSPVFLCDVSGDGLPDIIYKDNLGMISYRLNNGSGFEAVKPWKTSIANGTDETAVSFTVSGDAGITGGFEFLGLKWGVSAGVQGSVGMNNERLQIMDFNGDGYADLLTSLSKGKLHVRYATPGKTGLLKCVTLPLGGSISMDYGLTEANVYHSRRWVMTEVTLNDSLPGDGSDMQRTRIRYDYGYYDRTEREFLGFAVVVAEPVDEYGSALKSDICYYDNHSMHTSGNLLCEVLADIQYRDTLLYIVTSCSYDTSRIPVSIAGSQHPLYAVFPKLTRTQTCYYEGKATASITSWEEYDYENTYGNVVQKRQGSTDQPMVTTNISYHLQQNGNHCVNKPSNVEIRDAGGCLRRRTTRIDPMGHITEIHDTVDSYQVLVTRMRYDAYGNVVTLRSPNTTVHYTYDNSVHSYPVEILDTFNVSSRMQDYDFRFGLPRTVIDQADSRMEYTYDSWGRTETVRGPKEIAAQVPYTIKHTYSGREEATGSARRRAVSMAVTEHYDPQHPGNPIKTYTYCDGLGRIVQTRKEAAVNGVEKLVVSGRKGYDAFGRIAWDYLPEEIHRDSTRFRFLPVSGQPESVYYDLLDRPIMKIARNASFTFFGYGFNSGHLNKTLFSTVTIDANGHSSTELRDVDGKPWAVQASGQPFVYFNYNAVGDNTRTYSETGDWNRWYSYDRLGRKTLYMEENITEGYDYDGNNLAFTYCTWVNDETGDLCTRCVYYTYDAHRLLRVEPDDALPTEYRYDASGRVDTVYDESGLMAYEYGRMGEVTKETRIYALPFLSQPIALTTQFSYDSWGRVQNITYPDGEVVNYAYDLGGQLERMYNAQFTMYNYLDSIRYDKFGAKIGQKFGNGLKTSYTYEPVMRRLSSVSTRDPYGGTNSSMSYLYDFVGNITQLTSTYPWRPGETFTEDFTYDDADQLTSASSNAYSLNVTYGDWGKVSDYGFTSTASGNPVHHHRQYTYDPYCETFAAQSYTDNPSGEDVYFSYGINGSLQHKVTDFNPNMYPNAAPMEEFFLFSIAGNMQAYCKDYNDFTWYGYDASNTRTCKLRMYNAAQWSNGMPDELDLRVNQAVFYPNQYLTFDQDGRYTKHYYAGTQRIASRLGQSSLNIGCGQTLPQSLQSRLDSRRQLADTYFKTQLSQVIVMDQYREAMPVSVSTLTVDQLCVTAYHPMTGEPITNEPELEIFYYSVNHLGSTAFVTDCGCFVSQGFLYAPFGEIIDEYTGIVTYSALPKYAFNAKELDEESGMYYYEARYYAPPTFTSRDPLMNEKPWLTPYHYCSNNPVGRVDPTGCEDEYTWVKTGDGRIVYNSAVHTDADAVETYGEGSSTLAYGEEHKTKSGKTCTLEKGGIRVEGQFYKAKDEAPFFSKVGNAVRTLDEGGHSDGGNTGRITQQDVTVGLAVISAMTGVGAIAEVGFGWGSIVATAGVINSIDDACTNASGLSLSERMVKPENANAVHNVKTSVDLLNVYQGGISIKKGVVQPLGIMSTAFSGISAATRVMK